MAGVIVFNCPDDALYVILMDALVGCRVDILKLFMQCMVSVLVGKVVKAFLYDSSTSCFAKSMSYKSACI